MKIAALLGLGLLTCVPARADLDLARAQPIAARTAALALVAAETCQGFRIRRERIDAYLGLNGLTLQSAEDRFGTEMKVVIRDFATMNAMNKSPCDETYQRLGPDALNLIVR